MICRVFQVIIKSPDADQCDGAWRLGLAHLLRNIAYYRCLAGFKILLCGHATALVLFRMAVMYMSQ